MKWSEHSSEFLSQLFWRLYGNYPVASSIVMSVGWLTANKFTHIKLKLARNIKTETSPKELVGCCKAVTAIVKWMNGEREFDL